MIIVVLFTLLLLAGILAATLRLGLGSRQNTADQAATLRAQYAAESKVNLARSTLRDIQTMLAPTGTNAAGAIVPYMKLPPVGTVPVLSVIEAYARRFCGKEAVSDPWTDTSEFATPRNESDTQPYPGAKQCLVDKNSSLTAQKYAILADAVTPTAYNVLPASERPKPGQPLTDWWNKRLDNVDLGDAKYLVKPLRVVKLGNNSNVRYRFYLGVTSLSAKSSSGNGTRVLASKRTSKGDWWFEVTIPNPFNYNLFIDQWLSADGGFFNDVIDGDMFVNEKVRFLFGFNTVNFKGDVFSAGCTSFPTSEEAKSGADCAKSAGIYQPLNTLVAPPPNSDITAINNYLNTKMTNAGTQFAPGKKGTFTSQYIPLPTNASLQREDATESGIMLGSEERNVELMAGDESGNPLSSYNSNNSSWNEPSPTYQYIRVRNPGGQITNEYRYGPDGMLYVKTNNGNGKKGTWSSMGKTFNGVIYGGEQPAKPITVSGPDRIGNSQTADVSKMPPALASFAKINVTGASGLRLDSDLTMSNTPCDNQNSQKGCPKTGNDKPGNILGLYAPTGDIVMTNNTKNEATYHAAIMASQGTFNVEDYDSRPMQGHRHVIGSVVEKRYGLNGVARLDGTFVSGYGDDFSYDARLKEGILPPSSPLVVVGQFSDNSISGKKLDDVAWQQVGTGDY
ncbi:hypothetical protein E5F05_07165 [Deinococcus metallilatus]|uniref:DUF4900 domain-containing protein n=1 Tax=Deinococcus metallilatus TaxID=1211322 RepID=A0AAJ5F4Y7_9DEIO|nr:hypothetical protein [Deinococcus metallilatus]MBB5294727.1 hypothetical protein [Deinococcus metallilatus]QBY07754.1 hypothetical protein E5F05_07165 [Deinococcus metallilatus]RXJ14170.1 hypothetical protein ERJ73_06000 [Deinococcus metallilatus]TLK30135.1 hypothetical protein FCS05_06315 [Deinococcus metallilatus]GMA15944.1 hypothetical protein GCM10025871_22750 [Deinococcus metallilatus]